MSPVTDYGTVWPRFLGRH